MPTCLTCAPSLPFTAPDDFASGSAYFAPANPGAPCSDCKALADSAPGDFDPPVYFTPANPGAACTDCKTLLSINPPDLPVSGGVAHDPTLGLIVLQLEMVGNDSQVVTCQDLSTVTVAAGTFTVVADANSPAAVAAAKAAANQAAINQGTAICIAQSQ